VHAVRRLAPAEPAAHERAQRLLVDRAPGYGHDHSLDPLAPFVAGHADDGDVPRGRVLQDDVLDLGRGAPP
jgi:hypothetical protein